MRDRFSTTDIFLTQKIMYTRPEFIILHFIAVKMIYLQYILIRWDSNIFQPSEEF